MTSASDFLSSSPMERLISIRETTIIPYGIVQNRRSIESDAANEDNPMVPTNCRMIAFNMIPRTA